MNKFKLGKHEREDCRRERELGWDIEDVVMKLEVSVFMATERTIVCVMNALSQIAYFTH